MNRLLLAIDRFDSGQVALVFAAEIAGAAGADVTVLHVRERAVNPRVPALESLTDAQSLVDEAVFCLRQAGIGGEGRMVAARADRVARWIVYESGESRCDAIVLGSRRLRGIERASGRGVRERVIRSTQLPVLVAPATPINKVHRPYALESPGMNRPEATRHHRTPRKCANNGRELKPTATYGNRMAARRRFDANHGEQIKVRLT